MGSFFPPKGKKVLHDMRLLLEAEKREGLAGLDHGDRLLLYRLAIREIEGFDTRLADIWNLGDFGALPTVKVRLKRLEEQGWLVRVVNPKDPRSRMFVTSDRARNFFERASSSFKEAS